ncbi:type IV pilin [Natronococcus occultus]|uniref:Archaeal flagellin-like protein n=1 Tax=Natronococcus occultus SP4 TaxID=694430 RepID=L0JT06_9EURY|nr:type IV pilin [Natronococcus occultus]AGB36147.1 archaeal flagellin-like protein [Natronococcus occultus SP4]
MHSNASTQNGRSSDTERAVSPVIGVVLMVAVTVVLSAVIAGFVMEMGDGMEDSLEATGAASFDFDADDGVMTVSLVSEGNADEWEIVGDVEDSPVTEINGAGEAVTLACSDDTGNDDSTDGESNEELTAAETGTISVTASIDGGSSTVIGDTEYDCSDVAD